jgi:hypothetical protein
VGHRAGVPSGVAHNPSTTLGRPTTPRGHNLVVKELQRWLAVNCGLAENVKPGDARPRPCRGHRSSASASTRLYTCPVQYITTCPTIL